MHLREKLSISREVRTLSCYCAAAQLKHILLQEADHPQGTLERLRRPEYIERRADQYTYKHAYRPRADHAYRPVNEMVLKSEINYQQP